MSIALRMRVYDPKRTLADKLSDKVHLPIFVLTALSSFAQPTLTSFSCCLRQPINLPPPGPYTALQRPCSKQGHQRLVHELTPEAKSCAWLHRCYRRSPRPPPPQLWSTCLTRSSMPLSRNVLTAILILQRRTRTRRSFSRLARRLLAPSRGMTRRWMD